jgi:hypothetical protein
MHVLIQVAGCYKPLVLVFVVLHISTKAPMLHWRRCMHQTQKLCVVACTVCGHCSTLLGPSAPATPAEVQQCSPFLVLLQPLPYLHVQAVVWKSMQVPRVRKSLTRLCAVASQAQQAAWTLARPELHHRLSCWGSDPGPEDTSHAPAMAQLMLEQGVLTHDHITQPTPQHLCTTAESTPELDIHAKSGAQVCHCVHSWRKNECAERCDENEAPTDQRILGHPREFTSSTLA